MGLIGAILQLAAVEASTGLVAFGAVAVAVALALAFLLTRGGARESLYERIGAGGITREEEYTTAGPSTPTGASVTATQASAQASAERVREIRQMLGARSERLVRRGERALDVDGELARLLERSAAADESAGPSASRDPGLVAEVRQLVLARNERRSRRGEQPLDVDAEIARTLAELDP